MIAALFVLVLGATVLVACVVHVATGRRSRVLNLALRAVAFFLAPREPQPRQRRTVAHR